MISIYIQIVESNPTASSMENVNTGYSVENHVFTFKEIEIQDSSDTSYSKLEDSTVHANLTIVTAFWNISSYLCPNFDNLIRPFSYMANPLVIFTDSPSFVGAIKKHRAIFDDRTKIFLVNREAFWPFHLITQVRSVDPLPWYPPFHPNTLLPQYSASQHTKYAVLSRVAKEGYFNTPFYSWIGSGSIKHIVDSDTFCMLNPPEDFIESKIALNRMHDTVMPQSEERWKQNDFWVRSDVVLGIPDVIGKFEQMYHEAVLYYLDQKLMNTDQQVLRWLYSKEGRMTLHPSVDIQLYKSNNGGKAFLDISPIPQEHSFTRPGLTAGP